MATTELLTADFWQRTLTQAAHAAAGAALPLLVGGGFKLLTDVPWYAVLSAAALCAIVSVLASIVSVKAPGTEPASFIPTKLVDRLATRLDKSSDPQ